MLFSFFATGVLLIVDLLVNTVAAKLIPYYSQFTFNEALFLPRFITNLANFDGVHYINIAKHGYTVAGEYAFFPLYPLLIKLVSFIVSDYVIASLVLSMSFFIGGLFLLQRYLKISGTDAKTIRWIVIFILTFPTSFFFHSAYTESLFLFLFVSCLYLLHKKQYIPVFFLAYFAGLTKIIGIFVCVPIFFHILPDMQRYIKQKKWVKLISSFFLTFSSVLGTGTYLFYLLITTGDPLKFVHVMSTFGDQRKGLFVLFPQVIFRYFKIVLTARFNFQYFIALIELVVFVGFFIILAVGFINAIKKKKEQHMALKLGVFSFINLLLPTVSGSFSSVPRYVLLSLYGFMLLARMKNVYIKIGITGMFILLHIILISYFSQGYFIS